MHFGIATQGDILHYYSEVIHYKLQIGNQNHKNTKKNKELLPK